MTIELLVFQFCNCFHLGKVCSRSLNDHEHEFKMFIIHFDHLMNSEIPNMYIFIKMKLTNKAKNLDVSSEQLSFELIGSFTHQTNPFGRIRVKHDELGHFPNPSTEISFFHFSIMFKFFDISKISEGNWLISSVTLQPILDNDTHFFSNSSRYS